MERYPKQTWLQWAFGGFFKMQDWHTYTCEWDTAVIRFYVDGSKVSEYWKYYRMQPYTIHYCNILGFLDCHTATYQIRVASDCNPGRHEWQVLDGFPWNNQSESNLRFTAGLDQSADSHGGGTVLGQMEIDYVKIWQKHPSERWPSLCTDSAYTISGPDVVCDQAGYSVSPFSASGYWSTTGNLSIVAGNNFSVLVQKNGAGGEGTVYYHPATDKECKMEGMPAFTVQKTVFLGKPEGVSAVVARVNHLPHSTWYTLHAEQNNAPNLNVQYNMPITYEWDVYYDRNLSSYYHAFGQSISTPPFSYAAGVPPLKWTLKATNACGTVVKTGEIIGTFPQIIDESYATGSNLFLTTDGPVVYDNGDKNDPLNLYVVADITDPAAYEKAVAARLLQTFLPEDADSTTISSTIEQIRLEEL
jgi:hypothetical protein